MSDPPKSAPPPGKKMDPGWNDPPVLNYSAENPPPKSRIMNKRIAFPLSNASSPNSQTSSANNTPTLQSSSNSPNLKCPPSSTFQKPTEDAI